MEEAIVPILSLCCVPDVGRAVSLRVVDADASRMKSPVAGKTNDFENRAPKSRPVTFLNPLSWHIPPSSHYPIYLDIQGDSEIAVNWLL